MVALLEECHQYHAERTGLVQLAEQTGFVYSLMYSLLWTVLLSKRALDTAEASAQQPLRGAGVTLNLTLRTY